LARLGRDAVVAVCVALSALTPMPTSVAADPAPPWLPGPSAAGDDTYSGSIDTPSAGATVSQNSTIVVQGWVVDRTAVGWTGIDDVQVYLGLQEQGAPLLADAHVGLRRDDVAAALGNSDFTNAGFSVSFADNGLVVGSNLLTVYAHTPDKGWWYRQVEVRKPAPPDLPYADDPLVVVREAVPSLDSLTQITPTLTLRGYAIDRNMPPSLQVGVGGSGISRIQLYLDGPRQGDGIFLANASLGLKNREATGFGQRFLMSGWEIIVHPNEFSVDRHELYIYALSAFWPNESLVIIPFSVN
jgi:hypothetical protein